MQKHAKEIFKKRSTCILNIMWISWTVFLWQRKQVLPSFLIWTTLYMQETKNNNTIAPWHHWLAQAAQYRAINGSVSRIVIHLHIRQHSAFRCTPEGGCFMHTGRFSADWRLVTEATSPRFGVERFFFLFLLKMHSEWRIVRSPAALVSWAFDSFFIMLKWW